LIDYYDPTNPTNTFQQSGTTVSKNPNLGSSSANIQFPEITTSIPYNAQSFVLANLVVHAADESFVYANADFRGETVECGFIGEAAGFLYAS